MPQETHAEPKLSKLSESKPGFPHGSVTLQPSKRWLDIPEDDSLENSAYLGQFLGIGQIVHSDGQEYVQQCICEYGLRVGRQAKEKALASLRGSLQNFSA